MINFLLLFLTACISMDTTNRFLLNIYYVQVTSLPCNAEAQPENAHLGRRKNM